MGFEFICDESEIEQGAMKSFDAGGEKIIVFHISEGFFATQSKCTHLFFPLEKGSIIDDCRIQCKLHHAEFDIKTGKTEQWANFPPGIQALNFIRGEKDLKTFAVKVSDGQVSIDISQDASASDQINEKIVEDEPA